MAHFAEINDNNEVINIIVVNNKDMLDESGNENEQIGISFLKSLFGEHRKFVQTSYNHNFRKAYAIIGGTYSPNLNIFIRPQPFPSWSLDENYDWVSPVPYPSDTTFDYGWDEEILNWVKIE